MLGAVAISARSLAHLQIILHVVAPPIRVADVACVAHGALDDPSRRPNGIDPKAHVLNVVQRVKDAEDVHAVVLGESGYVSSKSGLV